MPALQAKLAEGFGCASGARTAHGKDGRHKAGSEHSAIQASLYT